MKTLMTMVAAALALGGTAASGKTLWNLPSGYSDSNYHTQNLRWFAEQVSKATNGELEIVLHPNASLYKVPDIKRAVQTGQVPIGEILLSVHGNEDPIYEADMIPFMASGLDRARELYAVQRPMLDQRLGKQGMRMLYSVPWSGNGIFSKKPMESLADFKGQRFRAYNSLTARLAEELGAQPTTVQVPELPQAFMTGIASVMIAAAVVGVDTKAWEYTSYFYDANAMHPRSAVLVNERAFSQLSPEHQAAILKIAAQAETRGWDLCRAASVTAVETLAKNGMKVSELSPTMRAEYTKVAEKIIANWVKRAGPDAEKLANAMR